MSAGTLDELDEISPEDVALVRQIRRNQSQRRASDYRVALMNRFRIRDEKKKPPVSSLPGGGYRQYMLVVGRHERADAKDVAAARAETERYAREHPGVPRSPVDPPKHVFVAGDVIVPETDEEALTLDQDPNKFREIGVAGDADGVDAVLAENARLKDRLARQKELDRREKELNEREAALAKDGKSKN